MEKASLPLLGNWIKCQLFPKSSVTGACDQVKLRLLGLDDLHDRAHTCRKAIENQGLVLVLNNMFDKCLQAQQPFWRKSIFPCLAAGTVLLGQLRLFVLGWSPTFSCFQTSNANKLQHETLHIPLAIKFHFSCRTPTLPFLSAARPPSSWPGLQSSPAAVALGLPPLC